MTIHIFINSYSNSFKFINPISIPPLTHSHFSYFFLHFLLILTTLLIFHHFININLSLNSFIYITNLTYFPPTQYKLTNNYYIHTISSIHHNHLQVILFLYISYKLLNSITTSLNLSIFIINSHFSYYNSNTTKPSHFDYTIQYIHYSLP